MKRLLMILIAFCFATGFTMCERKPGPPMTELPPAALLRDCPIAKPMKLSEFIKLSKEEREHALTIQDSDNINNLHACNTDKKSLRTWSSEMSEALKKYE